MVFGLNVGQGRGYSGSGTGTVRPGKYVIARNDTNSGFLQHPVGTKNGKTASVAQSRCVAGRSGCTVVVYTGWWPGGWYPGMGVVAEWVDPWWWHVVWVRVRPGTVLPLYPHCIPTVTGPWHCIPTVTGPGHCNHHCTGHCSHHCTVPATVRSTVSTTVLYRPCTVATTVLVPTWAPVPMAGHTR